MPLRKLEINAGQIMFDDALAGLVTTGLSDALGAEAQSSTQAGVVTLRVRWTIHGTPDDGRFPLEIFALRLGEFFPRAAFVGGRKYELQGAEPVRGRKLGFPYDTYYKFRIRARGPYDAAVFTKMPIACWQERDRAFAVVFPKELALPHASLPVFIKASGVGAGIEFSAALMKEFEVRRKPVGWFGAGVEDKKFDFAFPEGLSFEATFILIAADTWIECVRECERRLYETAHSGGEFSPESLAEKLDSSLRYYNRVWDARNRTHAHLPVKNEARFESVEFKHSHVTDDLTKLVLYRRLIMMGCRELTARESELLARLSEGGYRYRSDGSRLWHTTTYFTGAGLDAFTHHGAGFVGFPGGMATVARRLFEYCSISGETALTEMAGSAAEWLVATQREDGSWPASVADGHSSAGAGCVAGTAEAARALMAAYLQTEEPRYREAATAGIRYIGRDDSFFECRQYLRDVDADNFDGITAEACIHAVLDWYELTGDGRALELAEKWACYALQWVRPSSAEPAAGASFDGLSRSITPRIDVWGGLLIARAFMRLSKAAGRENWRRHAWRLFENIASLQERDGGLCETWFLDFPSGLQSILIEPTFVTDAFVEFILDLCPEKDGPLANILSVRRDSVRRKHPPLRPAGERSMPILISEADPEWIIDRKLRVGIAFESAYDWRSRAVQTAYSMMRELAPGRAALKLVPAMKILLDRHRTSPPRTGIGGTSRIGKVDSSEADSGKECTARRYRTPLHEIALSIAATGVDSENQPAADLELEVKTLVGDLRVGQVRIDLGGDYEILAVHGRDGFLVSCGRNEYSVEIIEGPVDSIIRDGDRLALDITMSSNWNYFGEYNLRLRIARRARVRDGAR